MSEKEIENSLKMNDVNLLASSHRHEAAYEVSVLVLTFRPVWTKLRETLDSIICQTDVMYEIVISDDGSEDNLFDEVEEYFREKSFRNYQLVQNAVNSGTVANSVSAVSAAKGNYVKFISPGDMLIGDCILAEWVQNMRKNYYKWSFCDVIFYSGSAENRRYYCFKAFPNDVRPYLKNNQQQCRWNYLVLRDLAVGAAIMAEKETALIYLRRILGKVKYAEDNAWRIAMFDGIVGGYFARDAVLYEYGVGTSTSGQEKWNKLLQDDWIAADCEMLNASNMDAYQQKIRNAMKCNGKIRSLFICGAMMMKLRRAFIPRRTHVL